MAGTGLPSKPALALLEAEAGADGLVTVDMGVPRFEWDRIPLSRAFEDTRAIDLAYALPDGRVLAGPSVVNVGNPHCIFWVEDADSYDLASFGHALEHHPLFPERANISLAEVCEDKTPSPQPSPQGERELAAAFVASEEDNSGVLSPRPHPLAGRQQSASSPRRACGRETE